MTAIISTYVTSADIAHCRDHTTSSPELIGQGGILTTHMSEADYYLSTVFSSTVALQMRHRYWDEKAVEACEGFLMFHVVSSCFGNLVIKHLWFCASHVE